MEAELDLRPIFQAILRRWLLIIGVAVGLMVVVASIALVIPPLHSASADLLVIPTSSRITLDERFVTGDIAQISSPTLQREGLIALGTSNTLEALALANLPPETRAQYAAAGSLRSAIEVSAQGDLLRFVARAPTDEQASIVAETWAKSYQQLIDDLFNGDAQLSAGLAVQLSEAEQRYNEAQLKLESFVVSSTLPELEQRVRNLQTLLSNAADADQKLYTDYLDRVRELELVVIDAQTLRDQVASGTTDGFGNALSLLSLRTRAAGATDLPLEVRFDATPNLNQDASATIEEIDRMIAVLGQRRGALLGQAQNLARSLAAGDGDLIGLASQVRTRYMKELSELVRQQEAQQSQKRIVEERRNIAFESLKLLQSKSDEQTIAQGSPQVEVRFINASVDAPASTMRRVLLNSAIGFALGLLLGLLLVVCIDVLRPALQRLNAPTSAAGTPLTPTSTEQTASN